ncbi:Protein of unknown function [Albimonas donghaensis]|uniref:DUF2842 domain-containing protein n=1 Tax=Albimonas donghaensis TaxID=356660 RepID=A0A1H2WV83_9RHOB|nr:DUF2842 domain-containing protein [Albimonas donghaensis]SDW84154.1 Protein of unknown function [Albimonas donghaensis]
MRLSWKARRRLSVLLLLVWLPLFVVAALYVTSLFDRPPMLLELAIYVGLGVIWALPFRAVFRGVGREPPENESPENESPENESDDDSGDSGGRG